MKTVVLAAGRGERLSPLTDRLPKPLLTLQGRPIIEHILRAFMEAGVTEFIIVTGYKEDILHTRLQNGRLGADITFVHNPDYTLGNGSSLLCARKALAGERYFLLSMSDHIIEPGLVEAALKGFQGESLLCVDSAPRYLPDVREATKVIVNERGYVRDIGKELSEWNGVDTGVFLLDTWIFDVMTEAETSSTLSDGMRRLIDDSSLRACDVSGLFWLDIDTWDDLKYARKVMREWT